MGWQETAWAVHQEAGSTAGKAVLFVVAEASRNRVCFLSHATIAERAEMTRRTVLREMKALEARGLIARSRRTSPYGQRTSDRIELKMSPAESDTPLAQGAGTPVPETGSQSDKHGQPKVTSTTCLSDTVAQEPVCEPVREPVFSLETTPSRKVNSRKKRLHPLPADFPDAAGRLVISERFHAARLPVDANAEAERFRDHHLAKGTQSADWSASLRTWITTGIAYAIAREQRAPTERSRPRNGSWSALEQELLQIASEWNEK